MNRDQMRNLLQAHAGKVWDILIIGGGATGLGIALDAASRGYRTLLLEQSDFSKGTSSKSTKLVHGGVRYLAKGDIGLVLEALAERGRLLKNAPHLTKNQEFIIPLYGFFDTALYTVGLLFYQLLAGRLGLGRSYFIGRKKVLERLPLLAGHHLKGGVVYHDGQFDDARMALSLALTSMEKGACLLNYCRVTGMIKDDAGRITGVRALDLLEQEKYLPAARVVINATGVYADRILQMDHPVAKATIRPSQGIHLVFDKSFLQSDSAIMIPKTNDGRVLFAIPWYDKVVVGTTDTPVDEVSLEPRALEQEIAFILSTAAIYLVKHPHRKDVLSIFAGLRPLAATSSPASGTREISRRHKITVSPSGLVSIVGGKWTTYRRMAEDTLRIAIKHSGMKWVPCSTKNMRLHGYEPNPGNRINPYGSYVHEIKQMIVSDPSLAMPLHRNLPYNKAEIIWITRNEMPCTLEDMLARRTRALLLDARASLEIAPVVAEMMAAELGHDDAWKEKQLTAYKELAANYLLEP